MLRKVRGLQLLMAIIKMVERKRIYGIYLFFFRGRKQKYLKLDMIFVFIV